MMNEFICSLVSSKHDPVRCGGGTVTVARNESRSKFNTSLLSKSGTRKHILRLLVANLSQNIAEPDQLTTGKAITH